MENKIFEDNHEFESFILPRLGDREKCDWTGIIKWLRVQFRIVPSEEISLQFSEDTIRKLLTILQYINENFLWYNSLEVPIQECLIETLKTLRVYVTTAGVAKYLLDDQIFYVIMNNLMECVFTKKNGQELFSKYLLQFILNLLSVGSEEERKEARKRIRESFCQHFRHNFMGAYGNIYETSAVLYNLLCDSDITDEGLINHIILYHADSNKQNEYLDFLVEKLISSDFLWELYEQLNLETRLTLLSCLREVLISPNSDSLVIKVNTVPRACLDCFIAVFNKSASVVFQVSQPGCPNATQEVSYILELLSHISSKEESLKHLQNNKDIFINSGMLLLNVHRLGKMSNNIFTPIQKLTQNDDQVDDSRNPVFGFKADLVRLIGNLCWKNRKMQDLAREAEVIPVLLDCCNIDEKNPFIIQWVIFAIRNLCENNRENQAIIFGLTQQGVINADVLQQFGLTLHAEEDLSIGIVGLNLNK